MSEQLTTAINALLKQVETLTEKVAEQDKRYDDVYRVNGKLLEQLKGPKPADKPAVTPTAADYAALLKKLEDRSRPDAPYRKEGGSVQLTRSEALDVTNYQQAQKLAQEQGVTLTIIDDRDGHEDDDKLPANSVYKQVDTSAIDMIEDAAQKVRYVRQDIAYGGAGYVQNSMAAEREGFRLRTFSDKDDLPEHMQTKLELMARAAVADSGGGDAD